MVTGGLNYTYKGNVVIKILAYFFKVLYVLCNVCMYMHVLIDRLKSFHLHVNWNIFYNLVSRLALI